MATKPSYSSETLRGDVEGLFSKLLLGEATSFPALQCGSSQRLLDLCHGVGHRLLLQGGQELKAQGASPARPL